MLAVVIFVVCLSGVKMALINCKEKFTKKMVWVELAPHVEVGGAEFLELFGWFLGI